jgi:Ca2+-binding EF-hand superfamily protein
MMTGFSSSDVKRVHRRFVALDTLKRGYVTVSDLQGLPEVGQNPLGDRICKVFAQGSGPGEENRNVVDFKEFLKALATFHKSNQAANKEEEKLRFLFKVFDSDGDGMLS